MRNIKKKYKRPKKPWDKTKLVEDRKVISEFGLGKKREMWKSEAIVRNFRRRARSLIAVKDEKATKILLDRVAGMGMIKSGQGLSDVLALSSSDALKRRLQTMVYSKGLAVSARQARQFVTHGHVYVDGRKVVFPSFIVPADKEEKIELRGVVKNEAGK
jgi:small subunit ribosomal protein S4